MNYSLKFKKRDNPGYFINNVTKVIWIPRNDMIFSSRFVISGIASVESVHYFLAPDFSPSQNNLL